jgi:hypothetical protein
MCNTSMLYVKARRNVGGGLLDLIAQFGHAGDDI